MTNIASLGAPVSHRHRWGRLLFLLLTLLPLALPTFAQTLTRWNVADGTPRLLPPGEYMATFRLKVADTTKAEPVYQATLDNTEVKITVRAEQFKAANAWQDFSVPFSLTTPVLARLAVSMATVATETVTVTQTRAYGDDEQLRLLEIPRKTGYVLPAGVTGIWLGRGMYHEYWRVPDVAPFIGELTTGAVYTDETGVHLRGFPTTVEELAKARVVVLANVPAEALTVEQRAVLEDFVKAGGGLIVLGGPYAFGAGGYQASDIFTRLLPVTPAGAFDVMKHPAPQSWKAAGPATLAVDLLAKNPPRVLYQHKLAPKKGAVVQVTAGGQPLIVTGAYGKGRVAAVLATPLGPDTPNAWWTSPLWPQIMVRVLAWAAGQ